MQLTRKNGKTRILAILLSVVMVLCFMPTAAFAESTEEPVLLGVGAPVGEAPEGGYQPGDTIRFPIEVSNNIYGFWTAIFSMVFDTEAFEFIGFDNTGALLEGKPYAAGHGSGAPTYKFIGIMSPAVTGEGALTYVEFKIKDEAVDGEYSFAINLKDENGIYKAENFGKYGPGGMIDMQAILDVELTSTDITIGNDEIVVPEEPTDPAIISFGDVPETSYPGDTFTVPVNIDDNPGFTAAMFEIGFDSDVLAIDSVTGGDLLSEVADESLFIWEEETPNVVAYANLLLEDITENGNLFNVTFKVKDDAPASTYNLTIGLKGGIDANFANANEEAQPVEFLPAEVVVVDIPEPPKVPTISLGSVTADVYEGDTFTVPVSIVDNPGFVAAMFKLIYDDSVLEIESVTGKDLLSSGTIIWDGPVTPDTVTFFDSLLNEVTEDGDLFEVTFKVKDGAEAATYNISLNMTPTSFVNADANPVEFELGEAISVNVVKKDEPPEFTGTTIYAESGASNIQGREIVVPVKIANNPGFNSFNFSIDYDKEALTLKDVDASTSDFNFLNAIWIPSIADPQGVGYAAVITQEGDGLLFNLVFTVNDDAAVDDYSISLSLRNGLAGNFVGVDENGPVTIPVEFESATVTVLEGLTPTVDNLIFSLPKTVKYGEDSSVEVTSALNMGAITVFYEGTNGTAYDRSTTPPTEVGEYTVSVDIAGNDEYISVSNMELGLLTIIKADAPIITWPTASDITYGQTFADVVLDGTSEYGEFVWDSSVDMVSIPDAGTYNLPVNFVPSENTLKNYEPVVSTQENVVVIVKKAAAPIITWPTASDITYGQTFADVVLDGTSEYGEFVWDSSVDMVSTPDAGTYNLPVNFVPSENTLKNYEAVATTQENVEVTVNKAVFDGTISWPTAADITEGSSLADSVLTGGSTEFGTFAWTNPTTVPNLGSGSYSVTFTPNDHYGKNYLINESTKNISINVWALGDVDMDGYITASDVLMTLMSVQGLVTFSEIQIKIADMDADTFVTVTDVIRALEKAMGIL